MPFIPAWSPAYLDSYVEALSEGFHIGNAAEPPLSQDALESIRADPEQWSRRRRDDDEIALPDGTIVKKAPSLDLWWVEGDEFVGAVEIRKELPNALYAAYAGHLSVGVRPSRRGKSTLLMLAATLAEAQQLGLKRVLVCCRVRNVPVLRWVEAYGIPIDEVPVPYSKEPDRLARFVIPLAEALRLPEPGSFVRRDEARDLVANRPDPGGFPQLGREDQPHLKDDA
jgi:predicted acetyltransferase